jgi:hypothetical protein
LRIAFNGLSYVINPAGSGKDFAVQHAPATCGVGRSAAAAGRVRQVTG